MRAISVRGLWLAVFLLLLLSLPGAHRAALVPGAAAAQGGPPGTSPAVHHDVSPPLRDLPSAPRSDAPREIPLRRTLHGVASGQPDGATQTSATTNAATTAGASFAGLGSGDYGFAPNAAPPDT